MIKRPTTIEKEATKPLFSPWSRATCWHLILLPSPSNSSVSMRQKFRIPFCFVSCFAADNNTKIQTMSGAEAAEPEGGTLLLSQPIVIDNGTASIKAGFAGSSKPKVSEGYAILCPSSRRLVFGLFHLATACH